MFTRRRMLSISVTASAVAGLAACGPNSSPGDSDGDGLALRFAWWGNPKRDELTREAIDAYTSDAASDGLTISAETSGFGDYWDKLSTQIAGGDAPDVIQMDELYLSEYGNRDVLLDLIEAGLDTSAFEDNVIATGEVAEKGMLAIGAGTNTPVMLANPEVFEEAGVDIPDDTTWTWDEMTELASRITEATPEGTYGIQQLGLNRTTFQVFMRQLGADLWSTNGVGFDANDATAFFQFVRKLQETGAAPHSSVAVEDASQSIDQTLFATGRSAFRTAYSNEVVGIDQLLGGEAHVLRFPSMTGTASDAQLWHKSGQYFSVSARSENVEAAVAFVDWLVNSTDAGNILLAERGVPGNLDVREMVAKELTGSDKKAADFVDAVADEVGDPPALTPQGGAQFDNILSRITEDLLFDRTDPAVAGESLFTEVSGAVGA